MVEDDADDLPPLVSPRSPSYERARRELAHPTPAGDADVVALLARLVELEHDAARACVAAAGVLPVAAAAAAESDADEHRARAEALGKVIEELGGSPPRADESRDLLAHGARAVEDAPSSPAVRDTLRAMRAELAAAYREASRDPELAPEQRDALARLAPDPPRGG